MKPFSLLPGLNIQNPSKLKTMNNTKLYLFIVVGVLIVSCIITILIITAHHPVSDNQKSAPIGVEQVDSAKVTVYFTKDINLDGLEKVLNPYLPRLHGKIGVKVHFGEDGNQYYIKPDLYKDLILRLNGTFIESNVLYRGRRRVTETHLQLAQEHGFGYAPIDILDADGEITLPYHGKHFDKVYVGSHINNYDSFLILSHFKGHGNAGFGGAIKNVGMGMAAIPGKMAIHADNHPLTSPKRCIKCGKCVRQCPANAISLNPLVIDQTKCISCGKCIGTCPSGALRIPWGATGENGFLERLADYANAITKGRDVIFVNFLVNISPDCDCADEAREPFVKDIGILASDDMVAIDAASCDLVDQAFGKTDAFLHVDKVSGRYVLDYGQQVGLGSKDYNLITK